MLYTYMYAVYVHVCLHSAMVGVPHRRLLPSLPTCAVFARVSKAMVGMRVGARDSHLIHIYFTPGGRPAWDTQGHAGRTMYRVASSLSKGRKIDR